MTGIDFWFSFGSTYTFLTASRLRKVIKKNNLNINFKPFSVRDVMKSMDNIPFPASKKSKVDHMWRDIQRRSMLYGIKVPDVPVPYPIKELDLANRVAMVGADEGWCLDYLEISYKLWFLEWKEAGSEENLNLTFRELGMDVEPILTKANSESIINNYQLQTQNAIKSGIFGSPSFIVSDEIFWGDDRLEDAINWFKSNRL